MSDTAEAHRFLDAMRAARVAGDVEAVADLFADDAVFGIVGIGEEARGKVAIRAMLASLIGQYAFLDWSPTQVFVEGENIAVRHNLRLRHVPSGRVVETHTCEFIALKDGRCQSFTQHVDTALVASLNAA